MTSDKKETEKKFSDLDNVRMGQNFSLQLQRTHAGLWDTQGTP